MQYHIQTTPIWDAFKKDCSCPLCEIYKIAQARLVSQYLNEAVMEPEYRVKVNKTGFCTDHLQKLYAGENKLGLSLQIQTRTDFVISQLKQPNNAKDALKHANKLQENINTCVICDTLDEMMDRYAYTTAQMYLSEKQFKDVFTSSNGFCMPHYILLLKHSSKAGKATKDYLISLSALQISSLKKVNQESKTFSDMFDYRSNKKLSANVDEIVPNSINKLKGEIINIKSK